MSPNQANPGKIVIHYEGADRQECSKVSSGRVLVGRSPECDIALPSSTISRVHLEISLSNGQWKLRDLNSRNGSYLNGHSVYSAALELPCRIRLGQHGPEIYVAAVSETKPVVEQKKPATAAKPAGKSGQPSPPDEPRSRTAWLIASILVGAVLIAAASLLYYQNRQLERASLIASEIFYDMKTMELQIADVEQLLRNSASAEQIAELQVKRQLLSGLQDRYASFTEELDILGNLRSEEDKLILKVARRFGECEVNMPPDFNKKVKEYIAKWQSTSRLKNTIERANSNGIPRVVAEAMQRNNLPAQFFYLGLQESGYQPRAVGPPTRYGHAKGIWQFIPDTGKRYGLQPGPLVEIGQYDPDDDRFNFEKATNAAARYLSDIYRTDAQASGLLVMASYNWGEHNIGRLLNKMPENPRERNFWNLLKHHKIPNETYDYVFYIFSAAVIGENPGLFGFDFSNPLAAFDSA